MKLFFQIFIFFLPWSLRRVILRSLYGYEIGEGCYIGHAWVFPKKLKMEPGSSIGHLTVVKGLDELILGPGAGIGRLNWITGFPRHPVHFSHLPERVSRLKLGAQTFITHRHLIDCTHEVEIGAFTTFAGFRSQILTHSIDIEKNRQDAAPVRIGDRCFIGTGCVFLAGSALPDYSVLAAGAVLSAAYTTTYRLYGGVPAKEIKSLPQDAAYFHRARGFVE